MRNTICDAFVREIKDKYSHVEVIAGVATGAIAHGMLVADRLNLPFIYVRSVPKSHGLANQIEGYYQHGQKVVVIEDLISTGMSSLAAVDSLREAGCEVLGLLAIFTYQFEQATSSFARAGVEFTALSNYTALIEIALEQGIITPSQLELLKSWRQNPEEWGR